MEVQVVGAGALNQAIKAVAIARGFVADSGLDLVCVPTFADIEIDGESRTAIRLLVEDRSRRQPVTLDMRSEPARVITGNQSGNGTSSGQGAVAGALDGAPDGAPLERVGVEGAAPAPPLG